MPFDSAGGPPDSPRGDTFGQGCPPPGDTTPGHPPPGWSGAEWQALDVGRSVSTTSQPVPLEHKSRHPKWLFRNVQAWVSGWLAPTISLELTATSPYWCRQWWLHNEAVARLDALWRAWEFYREQTCDHTNPAPAGMSLWWRDHANPHLEALLMSPRSPFRLCTRGIHSTPDPPLPADDPPVQWSAATASRLE